MMRVKDVMAICSSKYCASTTKLNDAAKIMKTTNCGALPIIDKDRKVVGIVTDRDIALALTSPKPATESTVKEVMSSKVYVIMFFFLLFGMITVP